MNKLKLRVSNLNACKRAIYYQHVIPLKEQPEDITDMTLITEFHNSLRNWYSRNIEKVVNREKAIKINVDHELVVTGHIDGTNEDMTTLFEFKVYYGENEYEIPRNYILQASVYANALSIDRLKIIRYNTFGKLEELTVEGKDKIEELAKEGLQELITLKEAIFKREIPERTYGYCLRCKWFDLCYKAKEVQDEALEELAGKLVKIRSAIKGLEGRKYTTETMIKEILKGAKGTYKTGGYRITVYETSREIITEEGKNFLKSHPDKDKFFTRTKPSKVIRVSEIKKS
ncbi:MAG: hypothetical protein DRP62_01525 [Planctomycetota bacterium]|nr:MAG: hypothetical protein DRP62_01525 [Planctomycetota bacterium]